jgi:DNA-binding NarL/FixJ family response regulator
LRTLLIDDHAVFTQGLKFLLSDLDETIEFIEATSCDEALKTERPGSVDLILLDYHMPGLHGLGALEAIKDNFPSATIVMLSSEDNPRLIREAIDNGAAGFVPKSSTAEVLVAALRLILAGGIYLPTSALTDVHDRVDLSSGDDGPSSTNEIDGLSGRQLEVLMKVIQGKANKAVAHELNISEGTVKAHLSTAFRVLGVRNRTEAVFAAAKLGLTSPATNPR